MPPKYPRAEGDVPGPGASPDPALHPAPLPVGTPMSVMVHAEADQLWEPHKKRPGPHCAGPDSRENCDKARP